MIRAGPRGTVGRRQLLRLAFLGAVSLAGAEIAASVVPFLKVQRIVGLGTPVNVGPKDQVLAAFAATNDAPILFRQGHFFLLHPPGGIVAAYRKCTHLGCAVPFSAVEDRFHCPCHGSIYDKRTAIVIRDPAPKPLQLFHMSETDAGLIVDTNPLRVIDRRDDRWDPSVIEIADSPA
ncbi:MAG TPA: Rieske 2Fe-2S domain-containing protein [Candidatus Limnocylindria bacterium]